jgi:hypothetical protein
MLSGFLERPELFLYHIKRYTTSLTTQMIFGFRVPREDDPLPKMLFYVSIPTLKLQITLSDSDIWYSCSIDSPRSPCLP